MLDLPLEVIQNIANKLDLVDIARLNATSHGMHHMISSLNFTIEFNWHLTKKHWLAFNTNRHIPISSITNTDQRFSKIIKSEFHVLRQYNSIFVEKNRKREELKKLKANKEVILMNSFLTLSIGFTILNIGFAYNKPSSCLFKSCLTLAVINLIMFIYHASRVLDTKRPYIPDIEEEIANMPTLKKV